MEKEDPRCRRSRSATETHESMGVVKGIKRRISRIQDVPKVAPVGGMGARGEWAVKEHEKKKALLRDKSN
jgi:hypothetical protein